MVSGVFSIPLDALGVASECPARNDSPPGLPLRQFIAGSENCLVPLAVRNLLDSEQPVYNPVVVYGPTGTGKSLLAHGLASCWKQQYPRQKLVLTTGADFARAYAGAVETAAVGDLRRKYRRVALLVVDGLHELMDKTAAQHELVRTLDSILDRGGRVLVTCPQSPLEMSKLVPGLISRLAAGLTVPLLPPGLAARRVILKQLAELHGLQLTRTVRNLLAEGLPGNSTPLATVPELNHAVVQLQSALEQGTALNEDQVRAFLAKQNDTRQPSLRQITQQVARYFNLRAADLKGSSRRQSVVRARGVAMYLARSLTAQTLEQVGQHYGGRDHTTVLHACRKTEQLMESDLATRQAVEELMRTIFAS